MQRWLLAALVLVGLGWTAHTPQAQAQVRLGASFYVQGTEPEAIYLNMGDLWFDTSQNALHVLIQKTPIVWAELVTGNYTNMPPTTLCPDGKTPQDYFVATTTGPWKASKLCKT